ncbi:outer membrane beta-barrel protein [Ekhidna sp.]|uniref:outer membrane beta-barrel protein n=1 Tax=Ekhidna sp. TaxID=2608089 RepID=UPI0032991A43
MKRLLIIGILMMPFLIQAQTFTIKSSFALSKWTGDGLDIDHENRTGFSFGLYYGTSLTDNLILNFGSRYISNGTIQRFSESLDVFNVSFHDLLVVKTSNLDIPILAQYMLNDRVYLLAGPYASFLLSEETTFTYTECIDSFCTGEKEKLDFDDVLESNSIGVELGIGAMVRKGLLIEINYLKELSSVIDQDDPVQNQSLMFTLGYSF